MITQPGPPMRKAKTAARAAKPIGGMKRHVRERVLEDPKEAAKKCMIRGVAEIARAFCLPQLEDEPRVWACCSKEAQDEAYRLISELVGLFSGTSFRTTSSTAKCDMAFQRFMRSAIETHE